uniref:Uncharacterized protein n=1 Tax=Anopheles minimus TaxID=112268 RepID=A0A182WGY7_9DIPT
MYVDMELKDAFSNQGHPRGKEIVACLIGSECKLSAYDLCQLEITSVFGSKRHIIKTLPCILVLWIGFETVGATDASRHYRRRGVMMRSFEAQDALVGVWRSFDVGCEEETETAYRYVQVFGLSTE